MIINNYSTSTFRTSSADPAAVAQITTPDKPLTHLSSSGTQIQQATADPSQGVDRLSSRGSVISQTSVSASEATTHQSSDKQRAEVDAAVARDLAQRDREVKNHEQIHASIGGAYASAPHFSYQKGPDGQLYAVDGDVSIDTSAVAGDPRATLEKAQVIIRAALSVPEPSTQDRRVAAQARAMAIDASAEIAKLDNPLEASAESSGSVETADNVKESGNPQGIDVGAEKKSEENSEDKDNVDRNKDSSDKRSVAEVNTQRASASQAAAASLQEFNNRLNQINQTLNDINLRLVDAGVFQKLFPEGSIIDKNV